MPATARARIYKLFLNMELRHIIAARLRLLHRLSCPWTSQDVPSSSYRGDYAELVAASYLRAAGLRVLRRRFRYGRRGELDIVAREEDTLVVCEVKSTISPGAGAPARAINHTKRRLLRHGAYNWLALLGRRVPVRFDVVEVYLAAGKRPRIVWRKDVFPLSSNR